MDTHLKHRERLKRECDKLIKYKANLEFLFYIPSRYVSVIEGFKIPTLGGRLAMVPRHATKPQKGCMTSSDASLSLRTQRIAQRQTAAQARSELEAIRQ